MSNDRRLALIVATEAYDDPGLSTLRAPGHDAEALAEVLADPELGNFTVDMIRNGTNVEVTERVEGLLSEAKTHDLIVLHFSGHGLKNADGELYLAARNTRPTRLVATAVSAAQVFQLILRSRSQRVVLLLDCCYGGAFERGFMPRAGGTVDVGENLRRAQERTPGRGLAVITASDAMEFAFEGGALDRSDVSPSVFTGALVAGLKTGKADRDQDGHVGLNELYDYVYEAVREESPNQTPGRWMFGLEGDLYIARNPRRDVIPAPLPVDLGAAIIDTDVMRRQGAATALGRLASGPDLPLAAAARLALEQMLNDDSKAVEDAVQAALERSSLRVSPAILDFGIVERAGSPVVRTVMVEGPPLVEALTITPSSPALHVKRAGRAIEIALNPSDVALIAPTTELEAAVEFQGRSGRRVVSVMATIIKPDATRPPAAALPAAPTAGDRAGDVIPSRPAAPPAATTTQGVVPVLDDTTSPMATTPNAAGSTIMPELGTEPTTPGSLPAATNRPKRRLGAGDWQAFWRGAVGWLFALWSVGLMTASGFNIGPALLAPIVGLAVDLVERVVPALRVPSGALVRLAGSGEVRGAVIQGLILALVLVPVIGTSYMLYGIVGLGVGFAIGELAGRALAAVGRRYDM